MHVPLGMIMGHLSCLFHSLVGSSSNSIINNSKSLMGIPMGAVQLPARKMIHPFRLLLIEVLNEPKLKFRGVEPLRGHQHHPELSQTDDSDDGDAVLVHLSPKAAVATESNPQIQAFLAQQAGTFHPFLRRCPTLQLKHLRERNTDAKTSTADNDNNNAFRFVELFSGIGGFRLGLESVGGKCVLANELNKEAASIYQANFLRRQGEDDDESSSTHSDNLLAVGDIMDLETENIPVFDCLVGGFPCQPFTKRGEQPGLEDERGQLYREIARILIDCQPKCFIFENVPGLVTLNGGSRVVHGKGNRPTFQTGTVFQHMLDVFQDDCGYNVDWRVLNSRKWLPQMRERVYIVGTRKDIQCEPPFNWDSLLLHNLEEESPTTIRDILEPATSPSVEASVVTDFQYKTIMSSRKRPLELVNVDGKAHTLISGYFSTNGESSQFIQQQGTNAASSLPRFFTPRECTRLMGFPEDFVVPQNNEKDIRAYYRAIGNAVSPIVIATIGRELIKSIRLAV